MWKFKVKSIVSQLAEEEKRPSTEVEVFCRNFKIAQLLRICNTYKLTGYPVVLFFLKLVELVFLKKSLSECKQTGLGGLLLGYRIPFS